MKKPYHAMNLSRALAIGEETEREPAPSEYGQFDADLYFVSRSIPNETILFPWEWIYIPEIVDYALECGIEIPDGTVDYSKVF